MNGVCVIEASCWCPDVMVFEDNDDDDDDDYRLMICNSNWQLNATCKLQLAKQICNLQLQLYVATLPNPL